MAQMADQCQESFMRLHKALVFALIVHSCSYWILMLVIRGLEWFFHRNMMMHGLEHVVAYTSWELSRVERKYIYS